MSGPSDKDNYMQSVVELLAAWREFKKGHDVESLRMKCCAVSEEFFRSLDSFEIEAMIMVEDELKARKEELE